MGQVELETGAEESAPVKPKKPKKRNTVMIYNKSLNGQTVTVPGQQKLRPGQSARVPFEWGMALVDRVKWIVRAERGDPMV